MLRYENKDETSNIIEVTNTEADVTFEIIREMKQEFSLLTPQPLFLHSSSQNR